MRAARQWYHLAGLLCALASVALHPSLGEVLFHRRDHRDQGEYPPTHNIFSVRTYEDAVTYLNKYGYLNCTVEGEGFAMAAAAERVDDLAQEGGSAQERKPLCSRQEIEVAFKQLQAKLNLKQTGLLDEETRLTMSAGRCGDIDVKQLGGSEAGAEAPPTSAYTTTTAESDTTTTAMRSTTGRTLPPETVSSSMIPRSQSTGTSTDSVTTTTEPTTTSNTTTTTEEEDRTTSMGMGSTVQEDRGSSPPTFAPSPSAPSAPSAGPPAPPARPSAPAPPPRPSAPAPVSPSTPPPPPSRVRRRAMIPGGLVPRELTADEWLADRMLLRRSQQPLLQRLIQPVEEPPASYSLYRREQILKDSIAKRESGDMVINDIEKELADEILRSGGFVRRKRTIKATEDEGPSQEVAGAARNNGRRLRDQFVSWRILPDGIGTKIPVSDQLSILGLAFRMWSEVIPLTFREVTAQHGHKVDIMIAFGKEQHFNCEKKFDGLGGELAHSCSGGCIHFDDEENYKKESKNSSDGIELLKVAVHEIGHVLGLFHNEDLHSIMYPIYNILRESQIEFELGPVDRKEIQSIYGCCKGSFDVVFDWLRRVPQKGNPGHYSYIFNSYFTRGETYWMYENNGNRTRYGDPLNITAEWPGLAANLDAYVQTIKDVGTHNRQVLEIKTYFFKNDMYYLYNDPEDRVAEGYPKTIASLNGADCNETIPDNIDASWYDVRKQAVHIFKGEWVWLVHVDDFASADGGCPLEKMRFTELFPMRAGRPHGRVLTGNVDSVYHAYRHYATYLFKGEDVWRNDCIYHSRSQNCLTYVGVWWRIWLDICDVE